jgi:predicted phosphodiesterase
MRVFALSDVHVDHDLNAQWIQGLSKLDYQDDVLILAGDVAHQLSLLAWCLGALVARFRSVLFVPGNHDLWVLGDARGKTSLQKFRDVISTVEASGASMRWRLLGNALIAPLLGWYDYSFGEPCQELRAMWMDYYACRWPPGFGDLQAAAYFSDLNPQVPPHRAPKVITFSHFLPRLDLLPAPASRPHRLLQPVLGSSRLEHQLRELKANVHVYGHSHVNRVVRLDGVTYVNNAIGYPREAGTACRQLLRIDEI